MRIVRCITIVILLALSLSAVEAQEKPAASAPMFGEYEPNAAYPYGRMNPNAPPELKQFEFMIGDCECIDDIRQPDGTWKEVNAKWNATFFMNGYGIQDKYWTDGDFVTSNIRIFDNKRSKWIVTFFSMPRYSSGVWEGSQEDGKMIMRSENENPDGSVSVSRLTFYNISVDGFDWIAERITGEDTVASWKSSCKKNRW